MHSEEKTRDPASNTVEGKDSHSRLSSDLDIYAVACGHLHSHTDTQSHVHTHTHKELENSLHKHG